MSGEAGSTWDAAVPLQPWHLPGGDCSGKERPAYWNAGPLRYPQHPGIIEAREQIARLKKRVTQVGAGSVRGAACTSCRAN